MSGTWVRGLAGAVVAAVVAAGAAGCSDDDTSPSDVVSKAASAVSSAASRASDALASASDAAQRKLDEVKNGLDAKDQVKLGDPSTDSDGRTTVDVSAENTADSTKSFAVKVDFRDKDDKLLDTVVVTLSDVAAGKTGRATARSTHDLSNDNVTATVGTALRY